MMKVCPTERQSSPSRRKGETCCFAPVVFSHGFHWADTKKKFPRVPMLGTETQAPGVWLGCSYSAPFLGAVTSLPSGFPSSFQAVTGLKESIGDEGQESCVIAVCRLLRDLALEDVTSWNLRVSSFLCCPAIPTKPIDKIWSSSCSKSLLMQKGRNY